MNDEPDSIEAMIFVVLVLGIWTCPIWLAYSLMYYSEKRLRRKSRREKKKPGGGPG